MDTYIEEKESWLAKLWRWFIGIIILAGGLGALVLWAWSERAPVYSLEDRVKNLEKEVAELKKTKN